MKYVKITTLILAVTLFVAACSSDSDNPVETTSDSFDRGAMLVNWADNIIIPGYTSFVSKTTDLKNTSTQFTDNPSLENLRVLRASWQEAYVGFQKISMFEIGKAEEIRFRNRLNIYPTKVSKIEGFISSGTYDFALPSTIDAQGFPALDYMLNGLDSTDEAILSFYTTNENAVAYKTYLNTLSQTISSLSKDVLVSWTSGFRDVFVANTSSSASGAVDKLTNDYIFYFEKSLRAGKVGIPAGVFSNSPLPQNVEAFYKKDISKQLLLSSLASTQDFFNGKSFNGTSSGQSFKGYLAFLNTIKNGENLGALINSQFDVARTRANELGANLSLQVESDNQKMLETYNELQRNVILLKVDMVQAFDVTIDYVDADGD